ncbi:MAG: Uma2 family endonuclease [Gemmatimonadales bacterium]
MAMPIQIPRYTVDQVRSFPEDGQRYELLDGFLLVTPAPANLHQIVTTNLTVALHQAVVPSRKARIVSIGELEIGARTLLNPDILIYPAFYPPTTPWKRIRDWWLAVEVLSPSTRIYDRDFKREAYVNLGVEEVWLVDSENRTIETWNEDGHNRISGGLLIWKPRDLRPDGIQIDLDQVFPRG